MRKLISQTFNSDCLQAMREMPSLAFDLAIVDPPYGINAPNMAMGTNPNRTDMKGGISVAVKLKNRLNQGSGKLKNRNIQQMKIEWDYEKPSAEYFEQLFRVSKHQIIWGGNYFNLPPTRCIVCWDKMQPWENFSQWEMAWTSFDRPAKMFRFSNTGGANSEIKIHPTQKPIILYSYLLKTFALENWKILDTHLGAGSSRIAAWNLGFDFEGYEIYKGYFNAQEKRFANHIAQPKLFYPQQIVEQVNLF